jgi:hypothetical protein
MAMNKTNNDQMLKNVVEGTYEIFNNLKISKDKGTNIDYENIDMRLRAANTFLKGILIEVHYQNTENKVIELNTQKKKSLI